MEEEGEDGNKPLSLSGFSELLGENMKNVYFPGGHTIYEEGDIGNHMYFINSGIIEVTTSKYLELRFFRRYQVSGL